METVRERLERWTEQPDATVLIAEDDRAAAGFVAVHQVRHFTRPGAWARIVALSVGDAHRRRGVGRALVAAAEAWAAARGCDAMEVTSRRRRDAAHPFYRTLGYTEESGRSARYRRSLRSAGAGAGAPAAVASAAEGVTPRPVGGAR